MDTAKKQHDDNQSHADKARVLLEHSIRGMHKALEELGHQDNTVRKTRAEYFCETLMKNTDNMKLSDAEFRQFVRNSLWFGEKT